MLMQGLFRTERSINFAGYAAMTGGIVGLVLAPILVVVKYMTGWSVIPRPGWVDLAESALGILVAFGSPPQLWTVYGGVYTAALLLMFVGLLSMSHSMRRESGRLASKAYWLVVAGFALVIPGDAVHSLTWHQNGLTIPTPGTNIVANTAYAAHMMGMNFVMIGSLSVGATALRRKLSVPWIAWLFVLLFPSAVLASISFLPTTPSGALWLYCVMMIAYGYAIVTGRHVWCVAA